ncbi:competence protein CoiA family protein [Angelakisella massiliensis]|uniref:competence protein CoiA family protein n=1 Tax=Angelakisella massiliensis TaxID=1871018 RepID=UPI0023A827E3|nr:competence protein CoiA family protein [Angelakisella massiliensis]
MVEVKNPFAISKIDGRVVMISDLLPEQKGKACNCICPECKGNFIARIGQKRVPHFAHDGEPCDSVKMILKSLYQLIKEALDEQGKFTVPSCYGYFNTNRFYHFMSLEEVRSNSSFTSIPQQRYDRIIKEQEFEVESSEIIKNNNEVPQWIIITENSKKHKLAVVILPPDTLCKGSHPKPVKGFSTVEIDLRSKRDFNSLKSMDLKKILIQQTEYKRWLSSPKITKWYEQQQAEQHKWYEKYCEKRAEKLSAPMVKCNENAVHEKSAVSVVCEEQGIYPPICAVIQDHRMEKEELLEFPSIYKDNAELLALQSHFSKEYNDVPTDAAVKDSYGRRWYFCNRCNQWYLAADMAIQGEGVYRNGKRERPNEGVCTFCSRKKPI